MNWWHRLGWVLLGLLVVAGAVHAPLHEAEADCGPLSLCSGAVILMAAAVALFLILVQEVVGHTSQALVVVTPQRGKGASRGRAPPL